MRKLTEEKKEILKYGICMGVVLFIVNVIYIGLQKDRGFTETIMPYFGLMLLGYAAAGVLFFAFCMGVVLFIVNVIYIGLQKDRGFTETIMPYFGLMLLGYAAAGVLFFAFYIVKEPKEDGLWKYCLKGTAGVYTIMNFMPLFLLAGVALADRMPVRMIFLLDAVVIGGFLIWDYRRVWIMSKKLNKKSVKTRVLLVDLEEAPKTVESGITEECG